MKKFISSLMVFITLFSSLPNVLAGKNGMPFQNINDPEYVEFLKDCDNVVKEMSILPSLPLDTLMFFAGELDKMCEKKTFSYTKILQLYSNLVEGRKWGVCICRHFAAYAFLKLHNIGKRCFYVFLYDINRNRQRDHAVAIYSIIENNKEIWKVCDISFAIMYKDKKWLSMNLIDYLNENDVTKSFASAVALDDPNSNNSFGNQNANDLKLYLVKYTPDYAKSFIKDMGYNFHVRNVNAINVGFGTSSITIGAQESKKLQDKQRDFLWDFIDDKANPNEAPNV